MGRTLLSHHDSPLGRWTRALYFPEPPLALHVEFFWYVAGRANFERDRRLPTGRSQLLFNLATPPILFSESRHQKPREFATSWISGQQQRFIETGSHGDTALLGAQFHSHGAWRLLRVGQHELSDQVVELEALCGDRLRGIRQQMLDAPSPQACFTVLERWLLRQLEQGKDAHPAVIAASAALAASAGQVQIAGLSRDIGVSQEYLSRRFREQIGLAPRAYASILRFGHALGLARRRSANWTQISHDCGYYDQAHLVRDFQRYSGRAPSSLLQDRTPDGDSIVVD